MALSLMNKAHYLATYFVLLNRRNSLPLMAINTLIQTPYRWLYNPIIEINTMGNIIEMFGNVINTLKYLPQSQSASVTTGVYIS